VGHPVYRGDGTLIGMRVPFSGTSPRASRGGEHDGLREPRELLDGWDPIGLLDPTRKVTV
jgi:hypothetical protein